MLIARDPVAFVDAEVMGDAVAAGSGTPGRSVAAFGGCSSQGQTKPGQAQPVQIVRRDHHNPGVSA